MKTDSCLTISGGGQDNIDHDVSHVEHESVTTSTRTWLIDEDRQHVLDACFADSENLKLKRDTTTIVASLFNIKKSLVQSIWRKAKHCHAEGVPFDLTSKKEKCGRHRVEVDLSLVPTIPLNRRTTIRDIASELHVSKSTMHRSFKDGKLCQESNTIKPLLKDENKEGHVRFCVAMLDNDTLPNHPTFSDMKNIVHLDEKLFNTTVKVRRFYLRPDEPKPLRTVHNKNAIDKVMFLAAVARPRYDNEGNCTFDWICGLLLRRLAYTF